MNSNVLRRSGLFAGLVALLCAGRAQAHVTLDHQQAPVGSTYKAIFRVPHGCDGAATLKVRVRIPEGVIAVKPMPKPGWELTTMHGVYKQTYSYSGSIVSEGTREVSWSGKLLDENYDEFIMQAYPTPDLPAGQTPSWPVVQECEDGRTERWIEIPAAGKVSEDHKLPAPILKLTPGATN